MKNKFILIEGGCRGLIDQITVEETELTLEELADSYNEDNLANLRDMFSEDNWDDEEGVEKRLNDYVADFGLEVEVFDSIIEGIGEIATVIIDEETRIYFVEFSEELFNALEDDNVVTMGDVEELIGLEF